jgi:PfaD family protein
MTQGTQIPLKVDVLSRDVLQESKGIGWWVGDISTIIVNPDAIGEYLSDIRSPVYCLLRGDGQHVVTADGHAEIGGRQPSTEALPLIGYSSRIIPTQLGDSTFCQDHAIRFPYMAGSMANGIASIELVEAMSRAGMLGSFGAAGLTIREIESAIDSLDQALGDRSYCFNLIYSPSEKGHEAAVVDLYLRRGIRLVEASAYMQLTLPVVRYRVQGIRRNSDGQIETPNRIIAKASRIEVAKKWFSPPPANLLAKLVEADEITREQAELAGHIPMAQDLTVEADSGGHTDNRPAITLLPTVIALRDRLQAQYQYTNPLRVGAAGGIATPASAAAAFAMGAAYVVTGTVNQACVESGSSNIVRQMLAEAEQADVAMAPAVDMFEMGVKLQVLKRGTMFAMRANKLYEYYRTYDSIEAIPENDRQSLEKSIFHAPLDEIWEITRDYFLQRDSDQIKRADDNPKHKMALIFRWYLGLSSRWANAGEASRQVDYQVWCGPAMGAFNEWVKGTWLAEPANRKVVTVAMNILYGAAVVTRMIHLRNQGAKLPLQAMKVEPLHIDVIEGYLN